jgi:hypothetical protein
MTILGRFIDEIVKDYESEQDKVRAREVFEDAKRVVLCDAPEPSFSADADKQKMFGVMIDFVKGILKDYPNPGYIRRPVVEAVAEQGLHAEGADEANNGGEGKDVEMEGHEKAKSQGQEEV